MKGNCIRRLGNRFTGAVLLFALAGFACAQMDFPTYKGDNGRTGKSGNFLSSGPGNGVLTWYHPNATDSAGRTITIDNTSRPTPPPPPTTYVGPPGPDYWSASGTWFGVDAASSGGAAFIPPDRVVPAGGVTYFAGATWPAAGTRLDVTDASNASPIVITTAANHNLFTGDTVNIAGVGGNTAANGDWTITVLSPTTFSLNGSTGNGAFTAGGDVQDRTDYQYAQCIASAPGNDPRVPLNAGDPLSVFTWTLRNPTVPFYENQQYAIYVNTPGGNTIVAGVSRSPERYYVYEVDYAGGTYFEAVLAQSNTWVRIGNGGLATNRLFECDGATPITVKLYNTVPRDPATGKLYDNPDPAGGDDLDLTKPRPLVYADAVRAVPAGGYYAATPVVSSFTGASGPVIATIGALNQFTVGTLNGNTVTSEQAVITSYFYNTGVRRWSFSPLQESTLTREIDNSETTYVTASGATPWTSDTAAPNYHGLDYLSHSLLVPPTAAADAQVVYAPPLNPGSYDIYAWIPGDGGTETFGHAVQYEIKEGGVIQTVTVDQSGTTAKGWVRVGSRSYLNSAGAGNQLTVTVTDLSTDAGDSGKLAYADSIRFVGPSSLTVSATPVQTTALIRTSVGGTPQPTPVVIVADENGKIYCLGADGNGDGTTKVYWTYPSTRDPSIPLPPPGSPDTWLDPNLNAPTAGNPNMDPIDGVNNTRIAEMPTGFARLSPLVERISGQDYLFISSTNGRVYCIEMAGRGDMTSTLPGSTRRVWTYPDDYPAPAKPALPKAFQGSVAFGTNTAGPTLFVPAMEGRMYALDAVGTVATHTTTARWTFPALTDPTIGAMATTPAVDFNKVFVGTHQTLSNPAGQFLALNWDTGAVVWTMPTPATPLSDFDGGPVTVDAASLGGGMPDTVFLSNDNDGLYALDAGTGVIQWETYEASAATMQPLTFTVMNVYDITGVQNPTEVIVAPLVNGHVSLFNAQTTNLNLSGTRFAGGYIPQGTSNNGSVAVGWNFMYFGDTAGYLYAFSNTAGGFGSGVTPPITTEESPNNPDASVFTHATVRFLKKSAFDALQAGTMYYADAIDPSNSEPRNAFEWGESIYLLVAHFPYQRAGSGSPIVSLGIVMGGEPKRTVFLPPRLFPDYASAPDDPSSGYVVYQYLIPPGGGGALPPGDGSFIASFNTVDNTGAPVNYPSSLTARVRIANPLALIVPGFNGPPQSIGNTNVTTDPESLVNGNGIYKPYILGSAGTVSDGQTDKFNIGVVDRSLVCLSGQGGLPGVRVERNQLAWQIDTVAGKGSPLDPLDPVLFPGFEDLPVNYPNTSLDYPDITPSAVTVTQNPTGDSVNPVFKAAVLNQPLAPDGSPVTETTKDNRVLVPTPWEFQIHVPRFQPPNEKLGNDQNNPPPGTGTVPAGYIAQFYVFVDSSGDNALARPNNVIQTDSQAPAPNIEPFRGFQVATSVSPDRRLSVLTPTVDLGNLAEGVGYTPDAPGPANALFDPWNSQYSQLFKSFIVANEGNVNFLNLRLAKATTVDNNTSDPWQILSPSNEDWAYLDGSADLWSDMDPKFAPMRDISPEGMVIGQKSRPGDRAPRQVTTNPVARPNNNTGIVTNSPRLPATTYPVQAPRVAVTIPFGFPVGTYVGLLKVIEDDSLGTSGSSMWENLDGSGNPTEPNSEPGLRVTFKPTEARTTSAPSTLDAPFFDSFSPTDTFRYGNLQPSGFRNPTNGSLVVAMTSPRPAWAPPAPTSAVPNSQWRLYLGAVQGTDPKTAPGTSPLRDLHGFMPDTTNNRWFHQSPITASGFPDPTQDTNIWGAGYVPGSAKYGSPVFASNGMVDPFPASGVGTGAPFANALMAFVGEARVGAGGDTGTQSEIFVAPVNVDNAGAIGIGNAYAMTNDATAAKGRPSIVQTSNGFVLFYAATVGGRSNIYYVLPSGTAGASQYDGSYFTNSSAINFGEGFESVSSPSATGRLYRGANATNPAGDPIIDLTFTGKIHGRNVPEVFYARIALDATHAPTSLMALPVRTREQVFQASQPDTYLADGVDWVTSAPITLEILRNGTYTDIQSSQPTIERGTGIITFDTKLGGKAYLDPVMGTVRLSGGQPPHDASLVLTYQPKILRISEGTAAGYASPNVAFDDRYIPDISYWRRGGDNSPVDATDPVRMGRYLFTYSRAAAGANQAARPMMKSMRLGVNLPLPVFTNNDGTTGPFAVTTGGTSVQYYQIDPAKKKVYFTADDEDKTVTITYDAADPTTGADLGSTTVTGSVQMIEERPEELVQLDQATNEQNLFMFLDPFDYVDFRRPGLVWLLWSSTRTGAPDVYMETIAPRFTPIVNSK